ncbi:dirigent protein 19-like [Chenopodium quinoa]|uniref:Dirigent protein n=1 Tax=Chenopodium quinoa TaxID=63459 RepID=A0A803LKY4_CHEQI|nr:dirigent protein 19-like [Chenopodium quinoa]
MIPKVSYPFGSMFAVNDPLTETPNPSSKLLGYMEAFAVTTNFDGERMICTCRTTLNLKGYKGELLNVGSCHFTQVTELPLVGGTGDFRFIQGYMIISPVDLMSPTTCYKVEFQLYWLHAALVH